MGLQSMYLVKKNLLAIWATHSNTLTHPYKFWMAKLICLKTLLKLHFKKVMSYKQ